jgi:multicomponent Na+:H+ antiporter subunit B
MRRLTWIALAAAIGVLFYAARDLPPVGDPHAPASLHVSPRYIEGSYKETGAPNYVTAVVVDYRGYDTLGETTVIFTAGLACLLILGARIGETKPSPPEDRS